LEYGTSAPIRNWDITTDGQRFLLVGSIASTHKPVTALHIVLNWTEELKRLAPSNDAGAR
jgi:hypothetical protein